MRILLVEDDEMIETATRQGLTLEGYAVDWARDAAEDDLVLVTADYELMHLDLGLPDRSGLEVLAGLRKKGSEVAVVILTAWDAVAERINNRNNPISWESQANIDFL